MLLVRLQAKLDIDILAEKGLFNLIRFTEKKASRVSRELDGVSASNVRFIS